MGKGRNMRADEKILPLLQGYLLPNRGMCQGSFFRRFFGGEVSVSCTCELSIYLTPMHGGGGESAHPAYIQPLNRLERYHKRVYM